MAIYCSLFVLFLFIIGTFGNLLSIAVFLRHKFRSRLITPVFIVLLITDSIYFTLRLIKLIYYNPALFIKYLGKSCTFPIIINIFYFISHKFHVLFSPLVHYETYIRFSLILMAFVSIQRCIHIKKTKIIINSNKWSYIFIVLAFILTYLFEFFGLTIFCSKKNNRLLLFNWFRYTVQHLHNYTRLLTMQMINNTNDYECIQQYIGHIRSNSTVSCTKEQLLNILGNMNDLVFVNIASLNQFLTIVHVLLFETVIK
ncbi:unnamed protein product [Didymodactylos carnosus]|uniref:G-protein coupled receptors family 1 profile domain-containing protein n=1 Tax=Didymodactylos carnosus TaxID=1234261 RepID=A0A815VWE5_9BILA|nr:unnamed protein product [Didymodactylos carnosus]CAF4400688.1 unnamed protein product [Didymodactylos carnosus]